MNKYLNEANLYDMSWRIRDISWEYKGITCTIIASYKKIYFTLDYYDDIHTKFPKTLIFRIFTTDVRSVNEYTKNEREIYNKCVSLLIDIGFDKMNDNEFILERNEPIHITYKYDMSEFSQLCDELVRTLNEVVPI